MFILVSRGDDMKNLKNWKGQVYINGVPMSEIPNIGDLTGELLIHLTPEGFETEAEQPLEDAPIFSDYKVGATYKVFVKEYMLKQSVPGFDFMALWNADVPMPLRIMVGEVLKESPKTVYMKLHGDMYAEQMKVCMKCGRVLTNPVSQYFGIGPECGHHGYVNPFDSDEELKKAVSQYRVKLQSLTWEGWIPKSAFIDMKEVESETN